MNVSRRSLDADFVIAACVFLPIIAISLLCWHYATVLRPAIPIELSNFDATRVMVSSQLHGSLNGDSWLPMRRALDVLDGADRHKLYETLFFRNHVRFQYPPTSLLPVRLFFALGISSVHGLNAVNSLIFALNAAAAGFLAWLLFRIAPRPDASRTYPLPHATVMAALIFAAAFLFYPLVRGYVLGQIQVWIDFLFTAAVIMWVLARRLLAGLLIGLACAIKPQLGLFLLWGLLWREWVFATGIVAGFLPLAILSLGLYGLHNHLAYLGVLSFLSRHGESFFANNSVNGILNWYFSPVDSLHWYDNAFTSYSPVVYVGTLIASLVALSGIVAPPLFSKSRPARLADLGAAAICTVVGSPIAWEHHYGILFPLYLVAIRYLLDMSAGLHRNLAAACILLSWILVADFIPFASLLATSPFAAAQAYCFFGALLLLGFFLVVPIGPAPATTPIVPA